MDTLLREHSLMIRRLRERHPNVTVEDLKQYLDRLLRFLKTNLYSPKKTDTLDLLTIVCDDLGSLHTNQLFNHPIIINHPIFVAIGQTFEMLLTKLNHLQSISMKKHEEDALYSISYFITQLCLHRNEPIVLFYGRISDQIHPITDKPNRRDETIDISANKFEDVTEKPNLKTARLRPSAPKSRPIETNKINLDILPRPKKNPNRLIVFLKEPLTTVPIPSPAMYTSFKDLPLKKYQDVFLTKTFFNRIQRGIDDLSQNDYPSYHVKYKVIDRLVRFCSKMNMIDSICDSIVKCLSSNMYCQVFTAIQSDQVRLTPKQLFFIHRCPQLCVRHEFSQKKRIVKLLCSTMISNTKLLIDQVLSDTDKISDSIDQNGRGLALQGLCSHFELLSHLSLTSSGRRYFLQSAISNQLIRILHIESLLNNACNNEEFFDVNVRIIGYTLMLLCNLAYEKTMFLLLKRTNLQAIYDKLNLAKDSGIKFANNTLSIILSDNDIDEVYEPMKLKQDYLEFIRDNVYESHEAVALNTYRLYKSKDSDTKYAFLTESFVETLSSDIRDLSSKPYNSNYTKYKLASQRVRVCTKQSTHEVDSLIIPIIECLRSQFYLNVFENIEFAKAKVASGALQTNRALSPKHIFFMRECPEFLIEHGHQKIQEVNEKLVGKMFQNTTIIFQQHLLTLTQTADRTEPFRGNEDEVNVDARIEALNYHIKLLNYFAMERSIRSKFLKTPIIEDIITVLQNKLVSNQLERMSDKKIEFIRQTLTLLYNLAIDKQILELMRSKRLSSTCSKFRCINDKIIQFTSQILLITLDEASGRDIREKNSVSKTSIDYMNKSIKVPKLCYNGVKLSCLLKNLKVIMEKDDLFTETLGEDKDGIKAVTNCVSAYQEDEKKKNKNENESIKPDAKTLEKIQYLAIDLVWKLSSYGPTTIKTLKLNDVFVDQVLKICKGSASKPKRVADALIWRLGSEQMVRFEQTQKEEERARRERDDPRDTTMDQSDDSVPFDLLISYSNHINDKIVSLRIADRLRQKRYRINAEKQGKHRLELMEKAVAKQKPILVCLSSKFRESNFCMAEVDYASKQKSPVIPIIVEENFTIKGWLNHIIANQKPIVFTNKNFNESFINLIVVLHEMKLFEDKD